VNTPHTFWDVLYALAYNLPMFVTAVASCIAAWKGIVNSDSLATVKHQTNHMQETMMGMAHAAGVTDEKTRAASTGQERIDERRDK
jgi:hypothetical protein